ncbi:hypothetical protein BC828DRAFT_382296 [Blastocladiella britannica]|nr:hypothetical protein BC828DRAFT_382296 [Blastocladiella britannica]
MSFMPSWSTNPRPIAFGWGFFIVAGIAGYQVVKNSILVQKREHVVILSRPVEELTWQERMKQDEERMIREAAK